MKQELVRTKSKICSLKREMSSIQQLHLAQQQVHAQLSAPTIISSREELEHYHSYHQPPRQYRSSSPSEQTPSNFTSNSDRSSRHTKKHSSSSNDGSLSPPAMVNPPPTCSVQSTQTTSRSSPSTISSFSNLLTQPSLPITNPTPIPQDHHHHQRSTSNINPSLTHHESSMSPSDEQLRLYLTETLQREKDSAV